jgi:integrase
MRGNITKRGRSSWRIKYDGPTGPNGERRTVYETIRWGSKREAQAKLAERLAAVGKGAFVAPNKLTIEAHIRERIGIWHASGQIGNATRERYDVLLKKQIKPHIGNVMLQRLETKDVEGWHAKLLAAGLSPRTARHAHVLLRKSLGDAVRHNQISRNVCAKDGQPAPTVPKKKPKILKKDQIADVVDGLRKTEIFLEAVLALFCGLRVGEVLALAWPAVDIENRVLHVRASVEEIAGQPLTIKQPKTEDGERRLSVPDIVVEALRDHRRRQLEQRLALGLGRPDADALVFPGQDGGPRRRTALSIRWGKVAAALGIPEITYHGLRHSHVSQLISEKVDIVTISTRIGHADPSITLRTYSHLFEESDAAAAQAINTALGASSVPKTS